MAAPTQQKAPTADMVANAFVQQYYYILEQKSERLHRFYNDNSECSHPDDNGGMETITTIDLIKKKFVEKGRLSVSVATLDFQGSFEKGVFVLVTGVVLGNDNLRKKFTQSFFLAPQDIGGFYVSNDVFRYVDDSILHNGDLGMLDDVSKERNEAITHVTELEERARELLETTAKQEALIETLRQHVQEYSSMKMDDESKLDHLLKDVCQQMHKENVDHEMLIEVSKERDEALTCATELKERVRELLETTAEQEALIETLRQQVQEYSSMKMDYESKLDHLLKDVCQHTYKENLDHEMLAEVSKECDEAIALATGLEEKLSKFVEASAKQEALIETLRQHALHQKKATQVDESSCHLYEVLKQLGKTNADISMETQGLHIARECVVKMIDTLSQPELEEERVHKNCEMYQALCEVEKEKHTKESNALSADLIEVSQKDQIKKEDDNILTREMIIALIMQVMRWSQEKFQEKGDDEDALCFWTSCDHCKMYFEYHRIYENDFLRCHNCHVVFMASEIDAPPEVSESFSISALQQPQNSTNDA